MEEIKTKVFTVQFYSEKIIHDGCFIRVVSEVTGKNWQIAQHSISKPVLYDLTSLAK